MPIATLLGTAEPDKKKLSRLLFSLVVFVMIGVLTYFEAQLYLHKTDKLLEKHERINDAIYGGIFTAMSIRVDEAVAQEINKHLEYDESN